MIKPRDVWALCKSERFLSVSLNVGIFVLLFLIFLQCGIFLNGSIKTDTEEAIPFDLRMLSASAQDAVYSLTPSLLQPAEIVVSSADGAYAAVNSAAVIGDLYAEFAPVLASVFAETPVRAREELWQHTVSVSDLIYIRYREPLPYQIIHAFAAAETGDASRVRQAETVSVSELCIRFADGEAIAVVRGETGVYSFRADTEVYLTDFFSYASMYPDVFYPCDLTHNCVITEKISSREIAVQIGICGEIMTNEAHFEKWVRQFRFNPDKLNYHVEPDGTAVYVESHGVLTCTSDRITYTAAEDGGVSVSEFCSVKGDVDIYTYLRAASAWISKVAAMDSRYTGGDASLCLTSVQTDGVSLTLRFSLCADNLPIFTDGDSTAFSMTFIGENLTEMVWRTAFVQRQLTYCESFLEEWSIRLFGTDRVSLAYLVSSAEPTVFAQWIAYGETEG